MLPSKIGAITHYVNDFSGVLSPEQREKLDALFQQIENTSGKQVVVVIFPHREGRELLEIGMEIFNNVGIGDKKLNNGLLLLLVSEEKKLRILVGKGLEFVYSNKWCEQIIEFHLRPLLNENKYEECILTWKNFVEKTKSLNSFSLSKNDILPLFIRASIISFLVPIFGFFGYFFFPFYGIYIYLALVCLLVLFLIFQWKKRKILRNYILGILFLSVIFVLPTLLIAHSQEYCKKNPEICEQRQREKENKFCEGRPASCINGRIDYNSADYKKYKQESHRTSSSTSHSSHSSSSSFGGGGGSSNGAGAGD